MTPFSTSMTIEALDPCFCRFQVTKMRPLSRVAPLVRFALTPFFTLSGLCPGYERTAAPSYVMRSRGGRRAMLTAAPPRLSGFRLAELRTGLPRYVAARHTPHGGFYRGRLTPCRVAEQAKKAYAACAAFRTFGPLRLLPGGNAKTRKRLILRHALCPCGVAKG